LNDVDGQRSHRDACIQEGHIFLAGGTALTFKTHYNALQFEESIDFDLPSRGALGMSRGAGPLNDPP